ncbi:MAG: MFS transporter [Sneathiellales bacterium]|nr:MFS transporter [Sneathiellales bacterium]
MFQILKNKVYRHLFLAQLVAVSGTGIATVALGLLAFELAEENAAAVLGTVFAIKMVAYVVLSPVANAFASRFPRRQYLIFMDVMRGSIAVSLPFVTEIWQIYILIFVLQAASAGFTPAYQATIPDVLPDEKDYTNALSLSRLAYDLESLLSPALAALLLAFMSFHSLFAFTSLGFFLSAFLILTITLPQPPHSPKGPVLEKITRGIRFYFATPRLRGLFALSLVIAMSTSMVFVNTVVIVQAELGLTPQDTAIAFTLFGGGSMIIALLLPRILDHLSDRPVMLLGGVLSCAGLFLSAFAATYNLVLLIWILIGVGYSLVQTPGGRLIKKSARPADRAGLFTAQFSLSHGCWLAGYLVAGYVATEFGISVSAFSLGSIALIGGISAFIVWPRHDPVEIPHIHADLPLDHPHLKEGHSHSEEGHVHDYVIDENHPVWPTR